MTRIAIFGDPVLDQVYRIADPIRTGGKMLGAYEMTVPGGTTANFACATSRYGLAATMVGRVAANWEGDLHRAGLAAFDVATDDLAAIKTERGAHTIIAIDPDGEKTLIYVPIDGPELPLDVNRDVLARCDLAYIMAADFARIADLTDQANAEVCVDVDAAAGLSAGAFRDVRDNSDVLFINDVGCRKLTGQNPSKAVVADLLGARATLLCCTGGGGTTYVARRSDGAVDITSSDARPAKVVDTTGAGDCFNAAFLAYRATGAPLDQVLDFAMAAGALATERLGARDAIPSPEAIKARMQT